MSKKPSGKQKIVINIPGNLRGRFLHLAIRKMADERDITISMMAYDILADAMDGLEEEFLDSIDASLMERLENSNAGSN